MRHIIEERGLRRSSILHYQFYLRRFAAYLERAGINDLSRLSPTLLSGFIAEYAPPRVPWETVRNACGTLRVFLSYLHREGVVAKNLSSLSSFRSRIDALAHSFHQFVMVESDPVPSDLERS